MTEEAKLIPHMRGDMDLTKLGLSVEEGFVASRIDGQSTVTDIALMVGKSKQELDPILDRLVNAGIIQLLKPGECLEEVARERSTSTAGAKKGYGNFIFPVHLMQEECVLKESDRKRVIHFFQKLEEATYYEILQVERREDEKAIKKAYFLRSKEWHPDRFGRGDLGSFKEMITEIFKKIQEAYQTLSSKKKRDEYDKGIVFAPDEGEVAEMLYKQRKEEREKRREKEKIERRKKRNPMRKRMDKAKKLFEEALELKEKGDLVAALRSAQTAAAFEQKNDKYSSLVEELRVATGEFRIGPHMRRGAYEENLTNWPDAIESFQAAVDMAPNHGPAHLRLAFNMLMGGRPAQDASTHAQKAVGFLPDDPEAHFVLGICYEQGGMEKAAVRAYAKAVELKPNYVDAKKRLKKLKWGF